MPKVDGAGPMPTDEAERAWIACRKGAEGDVMQAASDRRIYSLSFVRNGKQATATVGEFDPYYDRERIIAIIEIGGVYKICCAVRGFLKVGDTPMVGVGSAFDVKDFV